MKIMFLEAIGNYFFTDEDEARVVIALEPIFEKPTGVLKKASNELQKLGMARPGIDVVLKTLRLFDKR